MQKGDRTNGTLKITKVQRKLTGEELHAAQACLCGFHYPTYPTCYSLVRHISWAQWRVHSHRANDRHSPEQNEYFEMSSKAASLKLPQHESCDVWLI